MIALEDWLSLDEDALLMAIGQNLTRGDMHALPPSSERIKQIARAWTDDMAERIKGALCKNEEIRNLAEKSNLPELVSAVMAFLESVAVGTAATPLAVLLCKRGIAHLCSDVWQSGDGPDAVE